MWHLMTYVYVIHLCITGDKDDVYAECLGINVKFCETMHRQNMRSKKEMAMFYGMSIRSSETFSNLPHCKKKKKRLLWLVITT